MNDCSFIHLSHHIIPVKSYLINLVIWKTPVKFIELQKLVEKPSNMLWAV